MRALGCAQQRALATSYQHALSAGGAANGSSQLISALTRSACNNAAGAPR